MRSTPSSSTRRAPRSSSAGPSDEVTDKYYVVNQVIPSMIRDQDFTVDEKTRTVVMTDSGIAKMEKKLAVGNLYDPDRDRDPAPRRAGAAGPPPVPQRGGLRGEGRRGGHRRRVHRSHHAGPPLVGRPAPGHRGEGGGEDREREPDPRHDLVPELLPHVLEAVGHDRNGRHRGRASSPTSTSWTWWSSPRTGRTIRKDSEDLVYKTEREKFSALCTEIEERSTKGQPILVGTVSVAKSEVVSSLLKKRGVAHNVLNAKQHQREAEIVAQAGRKGAVTISTNMAGRGTDILLGGNPEMLAKHEVGPAPDAPMDGEEEAAFEAATRRVVAPPVRADGGAQGADREGARRGHGRGRPSHPRHRAPRVAPHRQPAARPRRASGRPRLVDLLPVPRRRPDAHLRRRTASPA